jgi:Nod factor-specific ABC transporter NodJ protein
MLNGFKGILYREFSVYKKKARKQILASSISPLLYLVAFGYGFGSAVEVGGLPYITFLIPGLVAMASLNQSFSIAQELNITRFYFHIFDIYLTAPVPPVQIVMGEAVYGMFKGFLSATIIFLLAFIFGVKLIISPLFFIAIIIHTLIFTTLGITVAMLVRDHGDQATVNNFIITPMIFLCGTFFPIDRLPVFMKWFVHILPLTYSSKVIRASLTGGEVNLYYLMIMCGFAIVFFITALMAVKRVEG